MKRPETWQDHAWMAVWDMEKILDFLKCNRKILEGYEQGVTKFGAHIHAYRHWAQWNMNKQLEGLRYSYGSASMTLGKPIQSVTQFPP